MEQDLFNWLNSNKTNSQGTGLLLAPLSDTPEPIPEEIDCQQKSQKFIDNEPEPEPVDPIPEIPEIIQPLPEEKDDPEPVEVPEEEVPEESECQQKSPILIDNKIQPEPEVHEVEIKVEEIESESESEELLQDHEWQERATGFTLSLDEPPPELWTGINDDDETDYEETDSLQGAAYVQVHGRNFTERLHHTLRHRKERAEERAEAERELEAASHPYVQKSIILCATLLMSLAFALLALWFIGRETPEGMKSRASALIEEGKFDEAAAIYQRAHRRYPNEPEFLSGLSQTSEKAGHEQTAKTAHEEYLRVTSKEPEPQPKKPVPPIEKPPTFEDYLNEANHAYNIGMYNRSVIYFFRAHAVKPRDLRPYIGLANAYRMKGLYFDSKRILDEAQSKFRRNPDIEMGYIFLMEGK